MWAVGSLSLAIALALLAIALGGCGEPEPQQEKTPAAKQITKTIPVKVKPKQVTHVVAEGETLWDIAIAYDTTVEQIMEANKLSDRDVRRLSKGRGLLIPGVEKVRAVKTASEREEERKKEIEALPKLEGAAYHFLADGETLWHVARLYDKSLAELIDRNEFDDDTARNLRPGAPVIVPGITNADVKKNANRIAEPIERKGIHHVLTPGETVWDLARTFGVSVSEIMAANRLDKNEVTLLRDGQKIFIPGAERDIKTGRIRKRGVSARQKHALARAASLGLGTRKAAGQLMRGQVRPAWQRAAGGDTMPGTLRWPVTNGWYVRGYGSGEGGYHLATDIMGEIGWNVRAAAPGIVAYSGDGVRGYGNMVIVVHPGGWVTMYAHNSVNFVVAGERVELGDVLAEVGSTGISRGPHVHFEFMASGKNCDPSALFRPGIRHRNGSRSKSVKRDVWKRSKPKDLRCAPRRRHPQSRWVVDENPETDQ